ncbi:MAG: histidine phosphatase family protein [Pseudomonadota bacterium]
MSGRIITARHGRPDLSREVRLTAKEYDAWWATYEETGLHADEAPPDALVRIAADAAHLWSSVRPRAVETARHAAGFEREPVQDPLFVEMPLPAPPLPGLRLAAGQWNVLARLFWIGGYAPPGVESHAAAWRRIGKAAGRLEEGAGDGDVLLCAHGYFNWMLDRHLRRAGWRRAERSGGNRYWSYRIYEPRGVKAAAPAPELA